MLLASSVNVYSCKKYLPRWLVMLAHTLNTRVQSTPPSNDTCTWYKSNQMSGILVRYNFKDQADQGHLQRQWV